MPKDILILGGGFGGVYAAHYLLKKLKKGEARVTLINDKNYFLFVPLIHEVATGNIRVHNVVAPIRSILKDENFRFCKSTVESIDLKKKKVKTEVDEHSYDYVVVALGSETNFYGMDGSNAFTLKSLQDAYRVRNHIIDMFEQANMASGKERKKLLTFTIVGGGPTGVELAAEIADWINHNHLKEYPMIGKDEVSLVLVDPNDKVLRGVDEKLRDKAMKVLQKKGIKIQANSMAKGISEDYLEYETKGKKRKLDTNTIIWAAGVKPVDIKVKGIEKDRGRIPVDSMLHIEGYGNAFASGDISCYTIPGTEQHPPPTAQLASQQAKGVSNNIIAALRGREQEEFVYKSRGFLASLGKGHAIAKIGQFRFYGFFAWWLWRTIYLMKLIGTENKLRVMLDWTFDLFFPRDSSQV